MTPRPPALFKKLEFDDGGKKAFVSILSRMHTNKLPRAQLKFLAEELLDMMEDKVGVRLHLWTVFTVCFVLTLFTLSSSFVSISVILLIIISLVFFFW